MSTKPASMSRANMKPLSHASETRSVTCSQASSSHWQPLLVDCGVSPNCNRLPLSDCISGLALEVPALQCQKVVDTATSPLKLDVIDGNEVVNESPSTLTRRMSMEFCQVEKGVKGVKDAKISCTSEDDKEEDDDLESPVKSNCSTTSSLSSTSSSPLAIYSTPTIPTIHPTEEVGAFRAGRLSRDVFQPLLHSWSSHNPPCNEAFLLPMEFTCNLPLSDVFDKSSGVSFGWRSRSRSCFICSLMTSNKVSECDTCQLAYHSSCAQRLTTVLLPHHLSSCPFHNALKLTEGSQSTETTCKAADSPTNSTSALLANLSELITSPSINNDNDDVITAHSKHDVMRQLFSLLFSANADTDSGCGDESPHYPTNQRQSRVLVTIPPAVVSRYWPIESDPPRAVKRHTTTKISPGKKRNVRRNGFRTSLAMHEEEKARLAKEQLLQLFHVPSVSVSVESDTKPLVPLQIVTPPVENGDVEDHAYVLLLRLVSMDSNVQPPREWRLDPRRRHRWTIGTGRHEDICIPPSNNGQQVEECISGLEIFFNPLEQRFEFLNTCSYQRALVDGVSYGPRTHHKFKQPSCEPKVVMGRFQSRFQPVDASETCSNVEECAILHDDTILLLGRVNCVKLSCSLLNAPPHT